MFSFPKLKINCVSRPVTVTGYLFNIYKYKSNYTVTFITLKSKCLDGGNGRVICYNIYLNFSNLGSNPTNALLSFAKYFKQFQHKPRNDFCHGQIYFYLNFFIHYFSFIYDIYIYIYIYIYIICCTDLIPRANDYSEVILNADIYITTELNHT